MFFLFQALKRAEEQSVEEGVSLEEVAARRWGSLARFHQLLDAAKQKAGLRQGGGPWFYG
jgi:hypothetical protein